MNKTLIAFTTKMGMSKRSAEIITNILSNKYEQKIDLINLDEREIKQNDLENYENIIIGSGIRMNKWYKKSLKFLKLNFTNKRVFAFICSMGAIAALDENNSFLYQQKMKKYLDNVVNKNPTIKLVSKEIFGGRKENKEDLKRENWNPMVVENWANKIGKILTNQ